LDSREKRNARFSDESLIDPAWQRAYFVRMKRLMLGLVIGAVTLGSAMADRPVVEQKDQRDNADYEYVYLTGSHIPQKVMKRNIITVGRNGPVLTIDRREMERNGNLPIADQLSRYPGISINHR
jgi:hypothetical protein